MAMIPDWVPEAIAYVAIAISGGALTYNNARLVRIEKKHDDDLKAVYDRINDCSSEIYVKMDKSIDKVLVAIKEQGEKTPSMDTCIGAQKLIKVQLDSHIELEVLARQSTAVALEQLNQAIDDVKKHLMENK